MILLTDVSAERQVTFSDDSFANAGDPYAPVVVARLPLGVDLRWHQDVVQRLARRSREIKAARVLNHWHELPLDLRRAITRTIREACISIVDSRSYALEFDQMVLNIGRGVGRNGLDQIRQRFLAGYVTDRVMWSSPAWRIQRMLFPGDPFGLGEVYGVSTDRQEDDSLFRALRAKLQKPHSVRLYGARSAAAFAELMDPDERARAVDELIDRRYFGFGDVEASILAKHRSTHHVFDEGNRPSVDAIDALREAADDALTRRDRWLLVLPPSGQVVEQSSFESPELQAADLAAGYARRLYESDEGLKKVCLEFRQVLLNGGIVRDWQQDIV
jgi:hypothetical protein